MLIPRSPKANIVANFSALKTNGISQKPLPNAKVKYAVKPTKNVDLQIHEKRSSSYEQWLKPIKTRRLSQTPNTKVPQLPPKLKKAEDSLEDVQGKDIIPNRSPVLTPRPATTLEPVVEEQNGWIEIYYQLGGKRHGFYIGKWPSGLTVSGSYHFDKPIGLWRFESSDGSFETRDYGVGPMISYLGLSGSK